MKTRTLLLSALMTFTLAGVADARDRRIDRDHNPPGRIGGPGGNWENPPGWRGGPGTSPDYLHWHHGGRSHRFERVAHGYYYSVGYGYWHPGYGFWNQAGRCWVDDDRNPPGRLGGRGTNWENPPGWRGGPGTSPDRFGRCR